ncbi:MAG: hypothetical protein LBR29_07815 [Methylobacteriaceae bacterium]|jgi:electron transfer flavoprotein beta subunit|nr:hypothetical protein [Methylobacteriaceae bacterium]
MRLVVLARQVPVNIRFDRITNTVVREEQDQQTNPPDLAALSLALAIKDRVSADLAVLTMGKPFAAKLLPAAAALGADRLYCVSDPAFAQSDTLATANILAAAIRRIGGADMILCGRRSIDGETGQVGPQVAVRLGLPCLTDISALEDVTETDIRVRRRLEDRVETWRVALPSLLTCCDRIDGIVHPRIAGISGLRRARDIPVSLLSRKDLPDLAGFGPGGSGTRVTGSGVVERSTVVMTGAGRGADTIAAAIRREREAKTP